ncbi:MAG: hypothetical protein JWN58_999 [Gammaproteobacteria bacterium]|nr:hypothetical protein [Gammaproteobacteria bacterium]
MSENATKPRPATAGELIALLQKCPAELPVLVRINFEDEKTDSFETFLLDPWPNIKGRQQTYMGDIDILRIESNFDEP